MTLNGLEELLKSITPNVFYVEAEKAQPPYIVYDDYRLNQMHADNKPLTGAWRVQVDYYTKNRNDNNGDNIANLLRDSEIPYRRSKTYDPDVKWVRHIYDCELVTNGTEDGQV